jgi:hypothetical protein
MQNKNEHFRYAWIWDVAHADMALMNIDTALNRTIATLLKLQPEEGIEILSYKRNRGVSVLRLSEGEFRVIERGYLEQELRLAPKELGKALKTIIKREFPRSRKVRLYNLTGAEDLNRQRKKL